MVLKNKKKRNEKTVKKGLAYSQIFLLVFSIVAISYAIGSEIPSVSGVTQEVTITEGLKKPATWQRTDTSSNIWSCISGCVDSSGEPLTNRQKNANLCIFYGSTFINQIGSCSNNVFTPRNPANINQLTSGSSSTLIGTLDESALASPPSATPVPADTGGDYVVSRDSFDYSSIYDPPDAIPPPAEIDEALDATTQRDTLVPTTGAGTRDKIANDYQLLNNQKRIDTIIAKGFKISDGTTTGFLKLDGKDEFGNQLYKIVDSNGATIPGKEGLTEAELSEFQQVGNWGAWGSNLLASLGWALLLKGASQFLLQAIGQSDSISDTGSTSIALGYLIGSNLNSLPASGFQGTEWLGSQYGWFTGGTWIGIGFGTAYFISKYKKESQITIQFNCLPWQPPLGGSNCELCNEGILPCSEYQCRSLGQACELLNKGTEDESCVWVNKNDVNPPVINANPNALLNQFYSYNPDDAILPPDRGVNIEYSETEDGCVPAFTPLRLGIESNEEAQCKIDVLRKDDFESMDFLMSNGLFQKNHTFAFSLPGSANLEEQGIEIQNNGDYEVFIRCQDANGNANIGNFIFKYCVEKGQDTTPPLIVSTSIPDNSPIAFNQSTIENFQINVNEPAECKWSHDDRSFEFMEGALTCGNTADKQGLYTCSGKITGLKDRFNNEIYFRCKDQPGAEETKRNVNTESHKITLIGTQPLVIDSVTPNNTVVKDATDVVKVTINAKTSAGYKQGESRCYFSNTGNEGSFIEFENTNSFEHSQNLFPASGIYSYDIRCTDLGGNSDSSKISFTVESDNSPPTIVRTYKEEDFIKFVTSEIAQCVYDVASCSYEFDSGIKIKTVDDLNHLTDWKRDTSLYVKCRDEFGNEPNPDECSIIARSSLGSIR